MILPTLIFILCFFLFPCFVSTVDDEIDKVHREKKMKRIFENHQHEALNCSSVKDQWQCKRECQLQIIRQDRECISPSTEQKCFDTPINYNYFWNESINPENFEILKRFPKCWSALAPLICSSIFRPCMMAEYSTIWDMNIQISKLFSTEVCENAVKKCQFTKEFGIWPEFLKCEGHNTWDPDKYPVASTLEQENRLFTRNQSCEETFLDEKLIFTSNQCYCPLINSPSYVAADLPPIIDQCFLPCETPITGVNWNLDDLRFLNGLISFISALIILTTTISLVFYSETNDQNFSNFCMIHAFSCIFFYNIFWIFGTFKSIRTFVLCVNDGLFRGQNNLSFFNLCTIEAVFSTFFLVTANFWLFLFFMGMILLPKNISKIFFLKLGGRKIRSPILLTGIAYFGLLTAILIFVFCFWRDLPVDPLSGICHIWAGPRHSTIFYFFNGLFCAVIIITAIHKTTCCKFDGCQREYQLSRIDNEEAATQTTSVLMHSITNQPSTICDGQETRELHSSEIKTEDKLLLWRFNHQVAHLITFYQKLGIFEIGIEDEESDSDIVADDNDDAVDADDEAEDDEIESSFIKPKFSGDVSNNNCLQETELEDAPNFNNDRPESPWIPASQVHINAEKDESVKLNTLEEGLRNKTENSIDGSNKIENNNKTIENESNRNYWLWFFVIVFISTISFSFIFKYYITADMDQEAEKEMIWANIKCSLISSIKPQNDTPAFGTNCSNFVVSDNKLINIFIVSIFLPLLPFWILTIYFIVGFKKVQKVLTFFCHESNRQKIQRIIPSQYVFIELIENSNIRV